MGTLFAYSITKPFSVPVNMVHCILIFCSADTRPGLVPKHVARRNELQKKEKLANEKNKQKPKAVIEKEKRDEGLGAALTSDNKGFNLLAKMGYKPGMALGKSGVYLVSDMCYF